MLSPIVGRKCTNKISSAQQFPLTTHLFARSACAYISDRSIAYSLPSSLERCTNVHEVNAVQTLHSDLGHLENWTKKNPLSHELRSERASAAERASEAGSAKQTNERADERVAQYLRPDS